MQTGFNSQSSIPRALQGVECCGILETGHHDFKTIVIDPITVIWSALQDGRLEFKTKNLDKAVSGEEKTFFSYQDWGQIKRFYSMLMTKLVNLPMHVVMIGRQKDEYEIKGNETRSGQNGIRKIDSLPAGYLFSSGSR
jgi:hypothetical protein